MNIPEGEDETEAKLKQIFLSRFHLNMNAIGETKPELLNAHLMGKEFQLQARDFVCLYFDIENKFHIKIPNEEITNGNFNSYSNILRIIKTCMSS